MPALLTRMSTLPSAAVILGDDGQYLGLFGDVGDEGRGLATARGDLVDGAGGVADVEHRDRRSFGGQARGEHLPDALGGAGDDGDPAGCAPVHATHTPSTATLVNRCGVATALSG